MGVVSFGTTMPKDNLKDKGPLRDFREEGKSKAVRRRVAHCTLGDLSDCGYGKA